MRLPSVLSESDLPLPELCAARLDGELFRVDHAFTPVDEIEQPRHRAHALRAGLSERLIAEQLSAAWIWGAVDAPPSPHQFCVALDARVGRARPPWMLVREVVIDEHDVVEFGSALVTSRLRTAVDLARFATSFDPAVVRRLGVDPGEAVAEIERRRNLPGKKRALARLSRELPRAELPAAEWVE